MPKHIPIRTCIGCREAHPKKDLVRIVRSPEGLVGIDSTGKAAGRGAYICRKQACLDLALSRNRLGKALRGNLTPQDVEKLKLQFDGLP